MGGVIKIILTPFSPLYYLKDMLGSVTALADAAGKVVERYAYDPYGKTTVTYADGVVELPPLAKSYFHDSNLDGDVDDADEAHLTSCLATPFEPTCVFVHDRNGDDRVDSQDTGAFFGCEMGSGVTPPGACRRPATAYFDCNGDKELEGFDWLGYHTCLNSASPLCKFTFDFDPDGPGPASPDSVINLDDYAEFQRAYGGPAVARAGGSVTTGASRFGNPFAWTGQQLDAGVGLYHFKYRSYSPVLGRWLERDPLGYIDEMSLYSYALSDPANWTDPYGDAVGNINKLKEMVGGVLTVGPVDAADAAYFADRGFAVQVANALTEKHGGENARTREGVRNATRHAAWQARLTQLHGPEKAKKIGDLHELGEEGTADSEADQFNNIVGRGIGGATDDIQGAVEKALLEGKLVTDPANDPRIKPKITKSLSQ